MGTACRMPRSPRHGKIRRTTSIWERSTSFRARLARCCSISSAGVEGNGLSGLYGIAISGYGRYVAFGSRASNLVTGDTNGVSDVFVRDLVLDTTECVSLDPAGNVGDGASVHPVLSADGRFVAFTSASER